MAIFHGIFLCLPEGNATDPQSSSLLFIIPYHTPILVNLFSGDSSKIDTNHPVDLKLLQQSHSLLLGLRRAGRQSQQLWPSEAGCGGVGRGNLGVGVAAGLLQFGWAGGGR